MIRSILKAVCVVSALMVISSSATGQERRRFQWPEKAKNLRFLPKDLGGQDLRRVMLGFSSALGVNCYHCHVGGPHLELVDFDFASDEKPQKKTARTMLKMVRSINGEYLETVTPSEGERRKITCQTCHRGAPRPGSIVTVLWETAERDGIEAAIAQYHELREEHYGAGVYDFSEATLNNLGYRFVGDGRLEEALAVFRLNAEQFPNGWNAWDSLAETCASLGDTVRAVTYYRRSLELNPDNQNAVEQLEKLAESESIEP